MTLMKTLGITLAACLVAAGALLFGCSQRPGRPGAEAASPRSGSSAFSDAPFTADMTIVTATPQFHGAANGSAGSSAPAAPVAYHGKMYAGADSLRTDVEMGSGATASVIVRYDKDISWILAPGKHYMEVPVQQQADLLGALHDQNARVEKQDLGPERVGSYPCEKYHVRVTDKGYTRSGWIWVAHAKALDGFVVKAQDEATKESVILSHIQRGAPPATVFDLPPGYHKITPAPH